MFGPFTTAEHADIPIKILKRTALLIVITVWGMYWGLLARPELGFDKLLHIGGGYIAGMSGVLFFSKLSCTYFCESRRYNACLIFITMLASLLIGGSWEFLQVMIPVLRDGLDSQIWDTAGDILFDLLGGYLAAKRYKKINFV